MKKLIRLHRSGLLFILLSTPPACLPPPSGGSGGAGSLPPVGSVACSDHQDNDGDGLLDYPEDPQCISVFDLSEGGQDRPDYSDVLVVVNVNSPTSIRIGDYFAMKRGLQPDQTCLIQVPGTTEDAFGRIEPERIQEADLVPLLDQVSACLRATSRLINFIVTTKGIPLGYFSANWPVGPNNRNALKTVDSVLMTMDASGDLLEFNPYLYSRKTFSHLDPDFQGLRLVTRLDGYDPGDVYRLIDQAEESMNQSPSRVSASLLYYDPSARPPSDPGWSFGNNAILMLAQSTRIPFLYGSTSQFPTDLTDLAMAFHWGSNDARSPFDFTWNHQMIPGGIMESAVSTGGRTLQAEREGGLSWKKPGRDWQHWVPRTKADIQKTYLTGLVRSGSVLFAGSGSPYFWFKNPRKGSGVFEYDLSTEQWLPVHFTSENTAGALVGNFIFDMSLDPITGDLFAATENGVSKLDVAAQVWTPVLRDIEAHVVAFTSSEIAIGTSQGLRLVSRSDGSIRTIATSAAPVLGDYVTDLAVADDSTLFAAIQGRGIARISGDEMQLFPLLAPEDNAGVQSLLLHESSLWVGSRSGALVELDPTSGNVLDQYRLSRGVTDLAVQGTTLLVGIQAPQVVRLDLGTRTSTYETFVGNEWSHVSSIELGADGTIYTGNHKYEQSLVAEAIGTGATGILGYISEPNHASAPHVLASRYLAGFTLGETLRLGRNGFAPQVALGDPKVSLYKDSHLPDIDFAFLRSDFLRRNYNKSLCLFSDDVDNDDTQGLSCSGIRDGSIPLDSSPTQITGRASTRSAQGSWRVVIQASDGTVVQEAQGGISQDKNIVASLPVSFSQTFPDTSGTATLIVEDENRVQSAIDTLSFDVPGGAISSPEEHAIFSKGETLVLQGRSRLRYRVTYSYALTSLQLPPGFDLAAFISPKTAGVSLANGGEPALSAQTLATIDLNETWIHSLQAQGDNYLNVSVMVEVAPGVEKQAATTQVRVRP